MKLKIRVTKEILKRSMMCNAEGFVGQVGENCAFALAVKDVFPNAYVGSVRIQVLGMFNGGYINLPNIAIEFIKEFDKLKNSPEKRLSLPEFEFEIELTDEVIDALPINIDEAIKIINQSKTLELA